MLLIFSSILTANNFDYISSLEGENLSYVDIQNMTTNTWTSSDEFGFFWYPRNTAIGDSLKFSLIGYMDKLVILESFNKTIYLAKKNVELDKITVLSTNNFKTEILDIPLVKRSVLLSKIPGSILKNYGNSAGISLFSIHGGRPEEVKILFDGIDLTNSQNGLSDISEIPEQMIKIINHESNLNLNHGSGSSDGIIALKPWSQETGFQIDKSNDGSLKYIISTNLKNKRNNTSLVIGNNKEPGNHPVNYNGQKVIRKNQYLNKQFLGVKNSYKINENTLINHSSWFIKNQRGINDVIWSEDLTSYRDNSLILTSISMIRNFRNKNIEFKIQNRISDEFYLNGNSNEVSKHLNKSTRYNLDYYTKINKKIFINILIESITNSIRSINTENHTEDILNLVLKNKFNITNRFKTEFALRVDNYPLFGRKTTQAFKLESRVFKTIRFSTSLGNGFRAPTFNDLYWKPGGNINLKPENSKYLIYKINYTKNNLIKISTTFKKYKYRDLIVWSSNGDYWTPKNIKRSDRTTIDFEAYYKINEKIKFQGALSRINSRDNEINKELRYSPNLIGSIDVNTYFKNYSIIFSTHYVGKQIIIYDYPRDKILDNYINSSLSLSFPRIFINKVQMTLSVSNLFDTEIVSIYGYPEPSRSMHMNISYTH